MEGYEMDDIFWQALDLVEETKDKGNIITESTYLYQFNKVMCSSMSIQNQNSTVDETQNERIENMEILIKTLEDRIKTLNDTKLKGSDLEPVMFYAILNSGSTLNSNAKTTGVFLSIVVNMGGNLNSNDGVFVAPRKGVFLFSWTVSSLGGKYIVTELVVQNRIIFNASETDTTGYHHSASMTALCIMQKGAHAFIRTTGYGSDHMIYSNSNYPESSFLGMLVHNEK